MTFCLTKRLHQHLQWSSDDQEPNTISEENEIRRRKRIEEREEKREEEERRGKKSRSISIGAKLSSLRTPASAATNSLNQQSVFAGTAELTRVSDH